MNKSFYNFTYSKNPHFKKIEFIGRIIKTVKLVGKNKNVLDVGCGYGHITELIKKQGNKVKCIETSDNAIKHIKKLGIEVFDIDLSTKWEENIKEKFDVVVCTEVIEHVFDTDNLINNINKVLKKGGHLVISTPNVASFGRRFMLLFGINPILEYTTRKEDAGHIRYFTFSDLEKLLKEHGFETIERHSDYINFSGDGKFASLFLANLFPKFGRSIILKAKKK